MTRGGRAAMALAALAVGVYYLWGVRAAGYGFVWDRDLPGYYDHLARGFAGGHLYLPVEPSPQLLALPNPWDASVDDSLKMFDAALYHRRYYLYHGAGPAAMLFLPWRLLTHHDLPENFALFVFCFGGYLFSAAALAAMLRESRVRAGPGTVALAMLALGLCQGIPFLLNRVWVYEVAIGSGYFCLAAGFFFYVRGANARWMAVSGLMFGMAIACRPHLGAAGILAIASLAAGRNSRRLAAFAIPFALVGSCVALYNYERFGNPLDFGNRHLVGAASQNEVKLLPANVPAGLFYLIASPPDINRVFPWFRLHSPPRDFPHPAGYTVEPTVGAWFLAPFVPLAFFVRRHRFMAVSAAVILLFLAATGWSTQRYEVDFLPWLVLFALGAAVRARGWRRVLMGAAIVFGVIVNLSIAISGPNDEMMKNRPAGFVRLGRWFSPVARYRPEIDPPIDVSFSAVPAPGMLFVAGQYTLSIVNSEGTPTLVSRYGDREVSRTLPQSGGRLRFRVVYADETMRVNCDGVELIDQMTGPLVAAPAEIRVGGK